MLVFGKMFMIHGVKHLSRNVNDSYDLSSHLKVLQTKRGKNQNSTNNVKDFHAIFSVLSALRSPIKLKLCNCSHRHLFEKKCSSRMNDRSYYS